MLLSTHENGVFLQGNFGQTCMRVSDRYMLTGGLRWRKLDAAMQIATAFKEQGISCGYAGLTINTLFHRFFEHDGAHVPDSGRGIFMIAREPSEHMRSSEDWIVKYFTNKDGVKLSNSTTRGGAGIPKDYPSEVTLYLVGGTYNDQGCNCTYCTNWREKINKLKADDDDDGDDDALIDTDDGPTLEPKLDGNLNTDDGPKLDQANKRPRLLRGKSSNDA